MPNRMTLAAAPIVVMVIAAGGATMQPGLAQTTAQPKAQAKADECLARPGAAAPRGSHWYYRIERPSGRRCWYVGAANQPIRAAAPAERRAVPIPAPAPSELRPAEARASETPRAVISESNAVAPSSVAATQFSAAWPHMPNGVSSNDREVPTVAANTGDAEAVATADTPPAETARLRPTLAAEDRATAQTSEPMPGLGHLAIFLAATVAFVAIAFRAVFKLAASWRGSRYRRSVPRPVPVRPAAPVIRRRAPEFASEPSIEAMSEPAIARLREIARRWDQPARVPRQPRMPAFEAEPDFKEATPAPRRRAVA